MTREKKAKRVRTPDQFRLDPVHRAVDVFHQEITKWVWKEKYSWGKESDPLTSMMRVCEGIYQHDTDEHMHEAFDAMQRCLWVPGGRIHAGAGTDKAVTLMNCYVMEDIPDSMEGIARVLKGSMLTMQQGGGIGMNFGTLRPAGAYLARTQAVASGPLPFMDMWDAMCATIMSAGSRRGAMMGMMTDDHPDLPAFIEAKRTKGRMTNFNVSVLVTDAFMDAVAQDEDWLLGFWIPRADGKHLAVVDRDEGPWYVYAVWRARELWDKIIKNTYEYSEPGVVFIDRINDQNNLNYCETLNATNPCGEQPLPPNGTCNLGAVNLARMVKDPFGLSPSFDFNLLRKVVKVGVRFLDNVIDVTGYPLVEQAGEEKAKRRIGLGITGLGNALAMMGFRYGTEVSLSFTDTVMKRIKETAYEASADLAAERGPFPLYERLRWATNSPVVDSLPQAIKTKIENHGIRNGVLLTIAPTGTTSLYVGNVSSGLEPVFLHQTQRKVRTPDGGYATYPVIDYGLLVYLTKHKSTLKDIEGVILPDSMVTHLDLTVDDHIRIQAVCQKHIDASVSKTINCPPDMTFEDFKLMYWTAYNSGCKGCTTYRESDVRGSVLGVSTTATKTVDNTKITRPEELTGKTYKIRWPNTDSSYYITINEMAGKPFEMFIASTSGQYSDWTTALCLMVSAVMRLGYDINFVPEELMKVSSTHDQGWVDGRHYGSLVALIGDILKRHIGGAVDIQGVSKESLPVEQPKPQVHLIAAGICPKCTQRSLITQEGCKTCQNPICNFSTCS